MDSRGHFSKVVTLGLYLPDCHRPAAATTTTTLKEGESEEMGIGTGITLIICPQEKREMEIFYDDPPHTYMQ